MLKFWHKVSYRNGTKNYTHELTHTYSLIEQSGWRVLSQETKKPFSYDSTTSIEQKLSPAWQNPNEIDDRIMVFMRQL